MRGLEGGRGRLLLGLQLEEAEGLLTGEEGGDHGCDRAHSRA